VRLSRWTCEELRTLQTEETFGDNRVFPMSALDAWKRVKRAARLAGITELPVSPPSCATLTAPMPCAAERIWRSFATPSVTSRSRRPAARLGTPDPRSPAAIYLAL
jgi:hypothetical protein